MAGPHEASMWPRLAPTRHTNTGGNGTKALVGLLFLRAMDQTIMSCNNRDVSEIMSRHERRRGWPKQRRQHKASNLLEAGHPSPTCGRIRGATREVELRQASRGQETL